MKQLFGLMLLIFVAAVGWRIGGSLSSDAMGMAIGMLFGIMAGIPTALLLLASERHRSHAARDIREKERSRDRHAQLPYGQSPYAQPPVIVVTGAPPQMVQSTPPQGQLGAHAPLPGQADWSAGTPAPPQRNFRIVGERDEAVEDW